MGHETSEHLSSPLIRPLLQSCNTSVCDLYKSEIPMGPLRIVQVAIAEAPAWRKNALAAIENAHKSLAAILDSMRELAHPHSDRRRGPCLGALHPNFRVKSVRELS